MKKRLAMALVLLALSGNAEAGFGNFWPFGENRSHKQPGQTVTCLGNPQPVLEPVTFLLLGCGLRVIAAIARFRDRRR